MPSDSELTINPVRESQLFWRLRFQILRTYIREAFRDARLKTGLLVVLSAIFWAGLFWLFLEGFQFLKLTLIQPSMRVQIVHAIFNTFFFTLTFMIALSAALVMYGSLYRSPETNMLLTLPVRPERIVNYKFEETLLISCWGFILLGLPLLIAYGLVNGAPLLYFGLLLPFMLSFVMIPASLGVLCCLYIAAFLPTVRKNAMQAAGAVFIVLVTWLLWQAYGAASQHQLTPAWVKEMLARLQFTEQQVLPSWWLSTGLLEAAQPDGVLWWQNEAWMFLALLVSNALLLQLVVNYSARQLFRRSYSRLQGLLPSQRPAKVNAGDRWLHAVLFPFSPVARSMMVKDIRLFRRDPVLWAQVAIFVGLMCLYLGSLQRFEFASNLTPWVTVMSLMNVGVVALIYSTFATRFILPLISLEGRAFWVLGAAPIARHTVITSKFLLASVVSVPACSTWIIAGTSMLPVAKLFPQLVAVEVVAVVSLCIAISALAVGNGARFPNLRESTPSRIASGFGGTLNLVESGLLILATVFMIGVPGYYWTLASDGLVNSPSGAWSLGTTECLVLGTIAAVVTCTLVTFSALRMGRLAFEKLEA